MSSETPASWFAEMDMEDPMLLQEFVGDCLVDYPPEGIAAVMEDDLHHSLSLSPASECNSSTAAADIISTSWAKRQKFDHHQRHHTLGPNTGPGGPAKILSFGSLTSDNAEPSTPNSSYDKGSGQGQGPEAHGSVLEKAKSSKRPKRQPEQCQNHIIAERQRRQNLSQRFIALSALIPGLKKLDKTSVLGEAINHMKELKDKLKILEEQNARTALESVVVVKRSQVIVENESNSSSSGNDDAAPTTHQDGRLPEIEARFSDKSVLIKVHCEMQKGILVKLIGEVERLHLDVQSTNVMPFNGRTLDITIMAQMESVFESTPRDVVKDLRSIFQ